MKRCCICVFLSEDYPFLTARRPKLEEWLRQLRTDGPGSEGKRSCQVPEQALKLLEEAERESWKSLTAGTGRAFEEVSAAFSGG